MQVIKKNTFVAYLRTTLYRVAKTSLIIYLHSPKLEYSINVNFVDIVDSYWHVDQNQRVDANLC